MSKQQNKKVLYIEGTSDLDNGSLRKAFATFMVQEAEAWILSQPDVLEAAKVSTSSLPKKNVMEITKPSETLARLYKNSKKEYHKVTEFVKVFPQLDSSKLKEYFDEYSRLIIALQ